MKHIILPFELAALVKMMQSIGLTKIYSRWKTTHITSKTLASSQCLARQKKNICSGDADRISHIKTDIPILVYMITEQPGCQPTLFNLMLD